MSSPHGGPVHILVVEDDPASLLMAQVALEKAGHTVDGAASAAEARVLLQRKRPQLILMDLVLPGIDGLEFTRQLKADPETTGIPVVALTAQGMPMYQRAAAAAGCDGFLLKVGSPSVLSGQVRELLDAFAERPVG